jgi:hypothetical protein
MIDVELFWIFSKTSVPDLAKFFNHALNTGTIVLKVFKGIVS